MIHTTEIKARSGEREAIARQTEEFLAKGGEIKRYGYDASNLKRLLLREASDAHYRVRENNNG